MTSPPFATAGSPHDLLPLTRAFAGREAEIEALLGQVEGRRVSWLTGPAGIGKTELVRAMGHRARQRNRFPGGIHHLSLEGAGPVASLIGDLVFALGIDERRPPREVFAGPPRLVIWDQMDGVLAYGPERLRTLLEERLAEADRVHHLVVCREGAPAEGTLVLQGLEPDAAFQAFVGHLPDTVSARPERDDRSLAEVLAQLEGNPLAIRLASRWCCPPRWTHVLPEGLKATAREAEPAFRGPLGRGLALAVDDLDKDARRMLGMLAALPGGAAENILYAVYGEDWEAPAAQLDASGLAEAGGDRRVLHPAVRPLVPHLLGARQHAVLWDQVTFHLQHTLLECALQFQAGHTEVPLNFLSREWENLRATFNWAVERLQDSSAVDEEEEATVVLDYGTAMYHLFSRRHMYAEGLLWFEACLDAANRTDRPFQRASLHDYAGLFHIRMGHTETADGYFAAALEGYLEAGAGPGVGTASYHLGLMRHNEGDRQKAREHFETALEKLRGTSPGYAAQAATYLGQIQLADEEPEAAYETLSEALNLYAERTHDPELNLAARFALAQAAFRTGREAESLTRAREAVEAAFLLHPRTAGVAVPHILKLADLYVRAGGAPIGAFAQDVVNLVEQVQRGRPKPHLVQQWQLMRPLLDRLANLMAAVSRAYGPDVPPETRDKARAVLPAAAAALDGVTGNLLGAAAWVAGLSA